MMDKALCQESLLFIFCRLLYHDRNPAMSTCHTYLVLYILFTLHGNLNNMFTGAISMCTAPNLSETLINSIVRMMIKQSTFTTQIYLNLVTI